MIWNVFKENSMKMMLKITMDFASMKEVIYFIKNLIHFPEAKTPSLYKLL